MAELFRHAAGCKNSNGFFKGKSKQCDLEWIDNQLLSILRVLWSPDHKTSQLYSPEQSKYFELVADLAFSQGLQSLDESLPGVSSFQIDFIKSCLKLDPLKRRTAQQLLDHPIFENVRRAEYEGKSQSKINVQVDFLKGKEYPLESIKSFIVKMV